MRRSMAIAVVSISAAVMMTPALSAPLFVGEMEIETSDGQTLKEVVDHCQKLGVSADDIPNPRSSTGIEEPQAPEPASAQISSHWDAMAITAEQLAMPGTYETEAQDIQENPEPVEGGENNDEGLAAIGIEDCKAAGLLF